MIPTKELKVIKIFQNISHPKTANHIKANGKESKYFGARNVKYGGVILQKS